MNTPLPKALIPPLPLPTAANTGLWFDKFCNTWPDNKWELKSDSDKSVDNPKLAWIKTVTAAKRGIAALLTEHATRAARLAEKLGGTHRVYTTTYRFASGLGRDHPIENGLTWHPTLGIPFLPGSSVKGMLRAYVENQEVVTSTKKNQILNRIFGPSANPSTKSSVGSVIFFDALPAAPVQLKADVMTPHYDDYYQDETGKTIPGDWHSPIPIPFLTVAPDQSFQFAIAPRTQTDEDKADCEKVLNWLSDALQTTGAGAKTAIGYGRFKRDEETETRLEKERADIMAKEEYQTKLISLSPIARELATAAHDGNWESDKNNFNQQFFFNEAWLLKIEKSPEPDILSEIKRLVEKHYPGLLANPDKTQGKKKGFAFKENPRKSAKRLNALLKAPPDPNTLS